MYKLWLNTDTDGNIVGTYGGYYAFAGEPLQEYQYYFEVTDVVFKSIGDYKIVNGELTQK